VEVRPFFLHFPYPLPAFQIYPAVVLGNGYSERLFVGFVVVYFFGLGGDGHDSQDEGSGYVEFTRANCIDIGVFQDGNERDANVFAEADGWRDPFHFGFDLLLVVMILALKDLVTLRHDLQELSDSVEQYGSSATVQQRADVHHYLSNFILFL
jgi:hypothetical protein